MSKQHFIGGRPPISALLIDISGTLHVGKTPTSNAVSAFHKLRQSSVPFRLCSNTSKESSTSLARRLEALGFDISLKTKKGDLQSLCKNGENPRMLWTSIAAAAQLVNNMDLKRPLLLLSESARAEVLSQLSEDNDNSHPDGGLSGNNGYDAVVIGLAPTCFDYDHLNEAFRVLKGEYETVPCNSDRPAVVPLIATHKAKYIQTEDELSLGPGPFVAALEMATGITAHVVGKPSKTFFEMVIDDFRFSDSLDSRGLPGNEDAVDNRSLSFKKGKIAVIGDDVEADLGGGAVDLGLWRVLVKTGKYRTGDETRAGIVPPDEVYDSFSDFVDSLIA